VRVSRIWEGSRQSRRSVERRGSSWLRYRAISVSGLSIPHWIEFRVGFAFRVAAAFALALSFAFWVFRPRFVGGQAIN
jgi:hypothetical protein